MSSNTLIKCQDRVLNILLNNLSTDLSPSQADQIMCKVQEELVRAYHIGAAEVNAAHEKERSERAWEIDYWFNRQMGS